MVKKALCHRGPTPKKTKPKKKGVENAQPVIHELGREQKQATGREHRKRKKAQKKLMGLGGEERQSNRSRPHGKRLGQTQKKTGRKTSETFFWHRRKNIRGAKKNRRGKGSMPLSSPECQKKHPTREEEKEKKRGKKRT